MDSFESWVAFQAGERVKNDALPCIECGKPAEGEVTMEEGEICLACHKKQLIADIYWERDHSWKFYLQDIIYYCRQFDGK